MSKRTKAELSMQEFDSHGVWNWTFPEGRKPPLPGHSLSVSCDFMTANEFMRSQRNRKEALSRQAEGNRKNE